MGIRKFGSFLLGVLLTALVPSAAFATGTWSPTSSMGTARGAQVHTATRLPDGRVLIAGGYNGSSWVASAEIYDPVTGAWSPTGSMSTARAYHTAALLSDGRVLVAGGSNGISIWASAEIYNPATSTWSPTGSMSTSRAYHTSTLLPDGRVLVAGGLEPPAYLASADIYDPTTGTWSPAGSMSTGRGVHTATLLSSGRVLVAGGYNGSSYVASADIYNPATGIWSPTGSMSAARVYHTDTRLPDGRVLVAGGTNGISVWASAEIYDPTLGTWSLTSPMSTPRYFHRATVLPDGGVLASGGSNGPSYLASAEIYSQTGTWSATDSMNTARGTHRETLLLDGRVLVTGGYSGSSSLASAEIFDSHQAPTLTSSTFYGGAGDQRGTAIAVSGGGLYVSGDVQPETGNSGDIALVLRYGLPSGPSPVWARSYGFGTNFHGIAATNEGVYAGGHNYSLTTDGVGGKENKSFLAKFAPDGSDGPAPGGATWLAMPHFFAYTGSEFFLAATSAVEAGSTFIYAAGGGQPCSFSAYAIAKFDTSGSLLAKATDPGQEGAFTSCSFSGTSSAGFGVTVLNGNVYAVGGRGNPATIWKHAPSLTVVWRQQDPATAVSQFTGVAAFGGAIYAVGNTYAGPNTEDYLIDKFDEAGTLLWRQVSGGANTDILTGVVGIGGRLFAVGYTLSSGAGGADSVVLEIDPATGATLSTTLFGGALDDKVRGATTDGTDLYVVGESTSFASAEGNTVGQNDVMLLRYALASSIPGCVDVTCTASDQCHDAGVCDPTTGICSNPAKGDGASCTDGNACTTGDACGSGFCQSGTGTLNVDDGNPCTVDTCNSSSGAVNTAGNAGAQCRAGNGVCDPAEFCDGSNAACPNDTKSPSTTTCDDSNACTTSDQCDGAGTCTGGPALDVDDDNPCTVDTCNSSSGAVHTPGNAGTECRPGNGVCDPAEVCDGTSEACPGDAKAPSTTSCDDSNACTTTDQCDGSGGCTGGPALNVDDGNPCTVDTCNSSSGAVHDPGNAGTVCRGSTGECDPAETCTGSSSACPTDGFVPNGTACTDDGDACSADFCSNGSCSHLVDAHCASCVGNAPPAVAQPSANPSAPVPFSGSGVIVSITANYTDLNTGPHSCVIAWGDGTSSPPSGSTAVTEPVGSNPGTCSGSHTYPPATNVYEVTVTIGDDCGASGSSVYQYVVVYDSNGGFVTGVGRINSPPQAYLYDLAAVGTANFGFVSKYKKGTTIPEGDTSFHFSAVGFRFESNSYEWLVISGAKARYHGTGSVNGTPGYGFELTAWDGQVTGGGDVDRFRIKIWQGSPGNVIYDNERGNPDGTDPVTALQSGIIVIHKK